MKKVILGLFIFLMLGVLQAQSKRPFLGVDLEETSDSNRFSISLVLPNSPAEKAGLKQGDIVIAVNGKKCKNLKDFSETIYVLAPGISIELALIREGKMISTILVLGEIPAELESPQKKKKENKVRKESKKGKGIYTPIQLTAKDTTLEEILDQIFEESAGHIQYISLSESVLKRRIGLSIQNLGAIYAAQYACLVSDVPFRAQMLGKDIALFIIYPFWNESSTTDKSETQPSKQKEFSMSSHAPYLGVDLAESLSEEEAKKLGKSGVLILQVIRFSPAESAGLKKGDLITAIGETAVSSPKDVAEKVAQSAVKDTLLFQVLREQQTLSISVILGPNPQSHGVLHQEIKANYDSVTLRDILEDLHTRTKGDFQYVATNEILSRYRFSMRVQGLHLQLFLSYLLSLIEWEYQLIQTSPQSHLMLILRPHNEQKKK
ncbi:MAG: PDZ domain-containing protein [Planctomycetota bacterium]